MIKSRILFISLILISVMQIPLFSFGFSRHGKSNYTEPVGMDLSELAIEDGLYTGTANGFRAGLIVEVSIVEGKISNIEVIDHNEVGRQYWQTPVNIIPGVITERKQSKVDVVSGATATSKAIMSAVEDALK